MASFISISKNVYKEGKVLKTSGKFHSYVIYEWSLKLYRLVVPRSWLKRESYN